jgi:hypothetical protein
LIKNVIYGGKVGGMKRKIDFTEVWDGENRFELIVRGFEGRFVSGIPTNPTFSLFPIHERPRNHLSQLITVIRPTKNPTTVSDYRVHMTTLLAPTRSDF